jgi:hypothetical protein
MNSWTKPQVQRLEWSTVAEHEHYWRLNLNSTHERALICGAGDATALMVEPIMQWPLFEGAVDPESIREKS